MALQNPAYIAASFPKFLENEIYFTSGGTECNNTIIRSVARLNKKTKNHIISTVIEHPSVLDTLKDLESEGFEVTYLPVDKDGKISIEPDGALIIRKDNSI